MIQTRPSPKRVDACQSKKNVVENAISIRASKAMTGFSSFARSWLGRMRSASRGERAVSCLYCRVRLPSGGGGGRRENICCGLAAGTAPPPSIGKAAGPLIVWSRRSVPSRAGCGWRTDEEDNWCRSLAPAVRSSVIQLAVRSSTNNPGSAASPPPSCYAGFRLLAFSRRT
jgi:hypothetical protein